MSGVRSSWERVVRKSFLIWLARSASVLRCFSRSSCTSRWRSISRRSEMSRRIVEAPTMRPEPSRMGEIVTETSSSFPSLVMRIVSK